MDYSFNRLGQSLRNENGIKMTLKKIEHDAITGETIERDYTPEEIDQHESILAERVEIEKKAKADAKAKIALLTKLGITAEEAALLVQ